MLTGRVAEAVKTSTGRRCLPTPRVKSPAGLWLDDGWRSQVESFLRAHGRGGRQGEPAVHGMRPTRVLRHRPPPACSSTPIRGWCWPTSASNICDACSRFTRQLDQAAVHRQAQGRASRYGLGRGHRDVEATNQNDEVMPPTTCSRSMPRAPPNDPVAQRTPHPGLLSAVLPAQPPEEAIRKTLVPRNPGSCGIPTG